MIPSHSLYKWIITDGEENAVPSIVLTIGDTEPVRSYFPSLLLTFSYIFNLNSSTFRCCKQMEQKVNKNVLLLFSDASLYYSSCFAGIKWNWSVRDRSGLYVIRTGKGIYACISSDGSSGSLSIYS